MLYEGQQVGINSVGLGRVHAAGQASPKGLVNDYCQS
jgi:hypothetical protein